MSRPPGFPCCEGGDFHAWWCAENTFRDENIRQMALHDGVQEAVIREQADAAVARSARYGYTEDTGTSTGT